MKNIYFLNLILFSFFQFFSVKALADIILNERSQDIPITTDNARFGVLNKMDSNLYWIQVEVNKTTSGHFVIECLSPHIEDFKINIFKEGRVVDYFHTGSLYPFNNRHYFHKNFVFPIPVSKGKYIIEIGIKNHQQYELYFKIRSYHFFLKYSVAEYFFLGFYYGILFIVFFYNFFLFIKSESLLHFFYSLYIIGCILLSAKEDGTVFQFIWPRFPQLNYYLMQYLAKPFYLISFLMYAIAFLEIKKYNPVNLKWLKRITFLYVLFLFVSYFFPSLKLFTDWLFFSGFAFVFFLSFRIGNKGNKFAYYFFSGFSIIVLSVLINILRILEILSSNILTVYIFNYGIILEVIIFSMALAERVRQTQEEKQQHKEDLIDQLNKNEKLQQELIEQLEAKKELQEKVNKELETKVSERTIELKKANIKLQEFAKEMDRLNSELDKYNYKLKKDIQEEKISRIYHQDVSIEQFLEIYPNDEACLKVIYELKWKDGFICKKCGYDKSSNATMWHKKKCNKCGYIESITSHTLFHHLKFPLNKAFYITYIEFANKEFTNETLSLLTNLRKPTVWSFRNKVAERMKEKKFSRISNWKEMILD